MSSKVNQKEYLKKYLSGEKKKHKSKRKTRDASRESSRVKIIDDDLDTRKKNYDDDDTDLILTGEDAPQIVGIVDERPSDLKTYEDFRTSGKWKSLSSNNHNASSHSHDQERKTTHRRSRERQRDDYRKSTETPPPRRNRSQDLSPVRRRRHGSEESVTRYERNTSNRKREFNSNRSDRRENVIHNDSKRGRDDNNPFRRKSFESKQSWKEDYSHKPSCRNDSPPIHRNNFDRINRKNDSNTKYHQSDYRRDMSDDRNKYNPFRSTFDNKQTKHSEPEHNISSSANDKYNYNNRGKANPFRSRPMLSSVSNSVSSEKRPSSSLPRQKRFDGDSHSFKQYNASQGSRYNNPFRNDLPQRSEDTGSKQFSNDRSFETRKRDFTDNKKYPLRDKFAPDQRGSLHYHNKNADNNWHKDKFPYKGSDESKGNNNRRNVSGFDRNNQYKHGDFRNGRNFKDDKRNIHEEKNSFHFSNSFKKRSYDELPTTSSRNSDQKLRDGRFERRTDAKRSRWDNNDNSSRLK